jgi:SAM-dependent methyltransferase
MTEITPDLIGKLVINDEKLFVPKSIIEAIASCVVSPPNDIRQEKERLKKLYKSYEKKMEPVVVDYSGDVTIDAYSIYYLPRNSLVPKMAFLCCAYNKAFQTLPKELRILDLGSGTGGVVLGLLDLFNNGVLSGTNLEIFALDVSAEALKRQERLIDCMGFSNKHVYQLKVDFSEPETYVGITSALAPWDMIFAANILTELNEKSIDTLLQNVSPMLSDTGILVIVEAQRDYIKRQTARIAKNAVNWGLNIYYPCPPTLICPKPDCWMWREDEFVSPDICFRGESIGTVEVQKANWMILSKEQKTIYDIFHEKNDDLVWGIAAPYKPEFENDKVKHDYEFCTEKGRLKGTIEQDKSEWLMLLQKELFKRGSMIGITSDRKSIEEGWDIVSGFITY